jgi:hypothetical protein
MHIIEILFDTDTKQPMLTLKTPCASKQSFPTLHAFKPAVQYFLKFVPLIFLFLFTSHVHILAHKPTKNKIKYWLIKYVILCCKKKVYKWYSYSCMILNFVPQPKKWVEQKKRLNLIGSYYYDGSSTRCG